MISYDHRATMMDRTRPHFPVRAVDQARIEAAVLFVKITPNHHSGELEMGSKMEVPAVIERAL